MPGKNTERIKIYVVMGLLLIFITVGFFRFFYNKAEADVGSGEQAELPSEIDLSRVQPTFQGRKPSNKKLAVESFRPIARNLFAPSNSLQRLNDPNVQKIEKKEQAPPPALTLKGTIVGSDTALAIVDGKVLRTGDEIAGFKVVWIGAKAIVLEAKEKRFTVEMLKVE